MIGARDEQTKAKKPAKGWGWAKFIAFLILLAFCIFLGGFLSFARHVDGLSPQTAMPKADGIVIWTGRGGGRLETGAQLLQDGRGERLLISGVNPTINADDIAALLGLGEAEATALTECCIDLDYAAENTIGNARETASWAKALDYDHIILVTSAYHMPRAQVEIANVAGRMRITPYPVLPPERKNWLTHWPRFKRLSGEYIKLLLAMIRAGRAEAQAPDVPIEPG